MFLGKLNLYCLLTKHVFLWTVIIYSTTFKTDSAVIEELKGQTSQHRDKEPSILKSEVRLAIATMSNGKSPGQDNIPGELLKEGGEQIVDYYTTLCNKVMDTGRWPTQWTTSLVVPLPKKGDLSQCKNHRTISLISHPSKILLRVLLNRLRPQVEQILSEEQAGFRRGRSTTEQIFNLHLLDEKHRNIGQVMYNTFVDYRKCFDRVWQEGMCAVLRKYNIGEGVVKAIETLYQDSTSKVLLNGVMSERLQDNGGGETGVSALPLPMQRVPRKHYGGGDRRGRGGGRVDWGKESEESALRR